jgi:hypothetical protein
MIAPDSILRRLPGQLDPKQLLFFDGIRHAAELVSLAYSRLQQTLTYIAREDGEVGGAFPAAFLDAWAVVDGIDRFRLLWKLIPGLTFSPPPAGEATFEEITTPVRNVRNVADHLAQRADYVVAQNGAALGSISWYTASRPDGREGVICILVPGTYRPGKHMFKTPGGRIAEYPTGRIELTAGEHRACLSDVLPQMEKRVRELEGALEGILKDLRSGGQQAGTDSLIRMRVTAAEPTPSPQLTEAGPTRRST